MDNPSQEAVALFSANNERTIHVICALKNDANLIHDLLIGQAGLDSLLVTSDTTAEEQAAAEHWNAERCNVLITTTVGLVGVLFNVLSFVQAMLRIRPRQRSSEARIVILADGSVRSDRVIADDRIFHDLSSDAGPLLAEDRRSYDALCSSEGRLSMMEEKENCRVQWMANSLGMLGNGAVFSEILQKLRPISMLWYNYAGVS